jgi:hypothetical protein
MLPVCKLEAVRPCGKHGGWTVAIRNQPNSCWTVAPLRALWPLLSATSGYTQGEAFTIATSIVAILHYACLSAVFFLGGGSNSSPLFIDQIHNIILQSINRNHISSDGWRNGGSPSTSLRALRCSFLSGASKNPDQFNSSGSQSYGLMQPVIWEWS